MPLRISVGSWRTTLLASVGLVGCSGSVIDSRGAPGPSPDSGSAETGGSSGTGGGTTATGGMSETGGTGGSVSNSGGQGGAGASFSCPGAKPVTEAGSGTGPSGGFVECATGAVHRPSAGDCWSRLADWKPVFSGHDGGADYVKCTTNADCTAKPNGYCVASVGFGGGGMPGANVSNCAYGCIRDADCATGEVCLCSDPIGTCVAATCTTDADCASGACIELGNLGATGCGFGPTYSFGCWKPDMTCITGADCTGGSVACNGGYCENVPVCGRPFIVEGAPCRAAPVRTGDWTVHLEPEGLTALDRSAREALAAHWTAVGLMEHASIAAFARFALELMALGAPPSLLESTQAALGDETYHARLCFGLASAYAGRGVGPGRLPVRGALASSAPEDVVRTAFLEACVGETCAAMEAAESGARATDPAVAAVLRRIAADETRHAELGWQFLKWALRTFGEAATRVVGEELVRLDTRSEAADVPEPREPGSEVTMGHGLLPPSIQRAVRSAALRDVVVPCARALLGAERAVAA